MTRTIALLFACAPLWAQPAAKPPHFEVASIRPSAPGGHGCILNSTFSSTQIRPTDCPVKTLIVAAWSLAPWELDLANAPAWISSERYDISAKSARPTSARGLTNMLGPLLEERFRLKWPRDKRELPVYYLTAAKGGIKLKPTKPGACVPFDHNSPPPPPIPGNPTSCDFILYPGTPDGLGLGIEGIGVPISSLASRLSSLLGRPVIDNTGPNAIYDIHLKFARDSSLAFGGRPEIAGQSPDLNGLPNIFTAIRSLGLNIATGKGPVEVFIVDSVQKPTEN